MPARTGLQDFLAEHDIFDNGANDDQVDTTTQAIRRMRHGGPGMLGFLKALSEEKDAKKAAAPTNGITYGYGPNWQPPEIPKKNW